MKIQELKNYRLLNVKTGEIDSFNLRFLKLNPLYVGTTIIIKGG